LCASTLCSNTFVRVYDLTAERKEQKHGNKENLSVAVVHMGGMSLFHFAGEQFLVDKWATMTDRLSCFHFFILWLGGFCTLKLQSYSNRFSSKSELSWFVEQHVAVASQQNL
jgi:hypothetical protein